MAKDTTSKVKWLGLIITIIVILSGLIANFVWAQADIKAVDVKIETIKIEGCLPARATDKAIEVINTRFDSMEAVQKIRYDAIMKAIDKGE